VPSVVLVTFNTGPPITKLSGEAGAEETPRRMVSTHAHSVPVPPADTSVAKTGGKPMSAHMGATIAALEVKVRVIRAPSGAMS
jgi:hypothetical protein